MRITYNHLIAKAWDIIEAANSVQFIHKKNPFIKFAFILVSDDRWHFDDENCGQHYYLSVNPKDTFKCKGHFKEIISYLNRAIEHHLTK